MLQPKWRHNQTNQEAGEEWLRPLSVLRKLINGPLFHPRVILMRFPAILNWGIVSCSYSYVAELLLLNHAETNDIYFGNPGNSILRACLPARLHWNAFYFTLLEPKNAVSFPKDEGPWLFIRMYLKNLWGCPVMFVYQLCTYNI